MRTSKHRGAILVMTLLIGSAITIVGVEIALFVMSSIRQSRTSDNSIRAFYAAESGVESIMHQVRKEDLTSFTTLRANRDSFDNASWKVEAYNPPAVVRGVLRDTIDELRRSLLSSGASVDISLYQRGAQGTYEAMANLKSLKITWDRETCSGQRPMIELTAVEFRAGMAINWNDPSTRLKKDIQSAPVRSGDVKTLYFNFVDNQGNAINKPMVVRIKAYFCNLEGVVFSLSDDLDGAGNRVGIPNYFYVNPKGSFASVTHDDVQTTFAAQEAHSGIFDFVLFSQEAIEKNE